MQIILCEDDGVFHGGIPEIIIVVVKFDDGKTKRLPYPADRTLSALYQDINSIAPQVAAQPQISLEEFRDASLENVQQVTPVIPKNVIVPHIIVQPPKAVQDKSNIIEKEDFVTLIRLDEGRNKEASCSLMVGQEYRVISVISTGVTLPGRDDITQVVQGYDVLDDKSDRPERTRVFPHEVALSRKRTSPIIKKELKIEEILPCPSCGNQTCLVLNGTDFQGSCSACNADISIARIIKHCQTDKCGNDVSCFDVGGKYQGKCNRCKSIIEVPYA